MSSICEACLNDRCECMHKLTTSGNGYWSKKQSSITVSKYELEGNELKVYFPTSEWDVMNDGLIYTDSLWIDELRRLLAAYGFSVEAVESIEYSEQGMQGDDYVSLDVGDVFAKQWNTYMKAEGI